MFLTNHARVLLCIAHDPGIRLRDIAARLDITERSAYGIVTDLAAAGYIVKQKDGRRNRYQIQAHLPLPEPTSRERTVGEILALLAGSRAFSTTSRSLGVMWSVGWRVSGQSRTVPPALNGRVNAPAACALLFIVVRDGRDQARHLRLSPPMGLHPARN